MDVSIEELNQLGLGKRRNVLDISVDSKIVSSILVVDMSYVLTQVKVKFLSRDVVPEP